MSETELKFQVRPGARDALEAELLRRGAIRINLEAIYHDTPDARLARGRLALRLRREGAVWVQTLKASGDTPVRRAEHGVELPSLTPELGTPVIEIERHHGTDAYEQLCKAIGGDPSDVTWVETFRTRVERLRCDVDVDGSTIEAAFDEGVVQANERSSAICELELELKVGDPAALIALGKCWAEHAGLWLSSVSKAERGARLLSGEAFGAAVRAQRPALRRRLPTGAALQAITAACLRQVLPNASDVADGCLDEAHVHQLRIGLRRLRVALRELGPLDPALDARFEPVLAAAFRALGATRDETAVAHRARSLLEAAGAPVVAWSGGRLPADPVDVVRTPDLQGVLLDLIGFTLAPTDRVGDSPGSLRTHLRARLKRLHRQVARAARRFETLPEIEQHHVRKRLKRLRYLAEFAAPLFDGRDVDRCLERLGPAQDALGAHVDTLVAIQRFRDEATRNPEALWSVDWLQGRLDVTAHACAKALKRVGEAPRFWTA